PRRDHLDDWTVTRPTLIRFGSEVKYKAETALTCAPGNSLNPTPEACQWCPAKAICPALRSFVDEQVMWEFALGDVGKLETACFTGDRNYPTPAAIALVETWASAMKAAIFERLQKFEPVPGWKLVKGREGNRRWKDESAVEQLLTSWHIKKSDS